MLDEYMSSDAISQPETRSNGDAPDTLEVVTRRVNECFDKMARAQRDHDKYRRTAGQSLIELRRRVEDGEAGDVTWTAYCLANIQRSPSDIRKVMQIAGATDPDAEAERQRKAAARSMAKTRAERSNIGAVPAEPASTDYLEPDDEDEDDPSDSPDAQAKKQWEETVSLAHRTITEQLKLGALAKGTRTESGKYIPPGAVFCPEVAMIPVPLIPLYFVAAYDGRANIIDLAWACYHAAERGYRDEFVRRIATPEALGDEFVRRIAKPEVFEKEAAAATIRAAFEKLRGETAHSDAVLAELAYRLNGRGLEELAVKLREKITPGRFKKFVAVLTGGTAGDEEPTEGNRDAA